MKGVSTLLLLAAALPACTHAADFDYTYADVAATKAYSDIEGGFNLYSGGGGYLLDGSYGLGRHWFLEGSYQENRFHASLAATPTSSFDIALIPKNLRLGGGFHTALSGNVDFTGHLDYARAKTDLEIPAVSPVPDIDDHGYVAGVGLRAHVTDKLELDAGLDHDNVGFGLQYSRACNYCYVVAIARQDGTENVLSAAARYRFDVLGLGIEYRHSSFQGWRDWLFSLRANF